MYDLRLINLGLVYRNSENEFFKLLKVHLHSSMRFLSLHANCITDKKDIESLSQQRSLHLDAFQRAFFRTLLYKENCLIRQIIYNIYCVIQRDNHIYTSSKSTGFLARIR